MLLCGWGCESSLRKSCTGKSPLAPLFLRGELCLNVVVVLIVTFYKPPLNKEGFVIVTL